MPTERTTPTHVFFWHGVFSNWHRGAPFSGARAYEETVERLDALGVARPSDQALSSRLLRAATFGCGEQWMMACKAWLFDRRPIALDEDPSIDVARTLATILATKEPHQIARLAPLGKVLHTSDPKAQKAIGRQVEGYDDKLWGAARVACVVGGSIARFEADASALKALLATGDRVLVEGSPYDHIWGVKLRFDDPKIDNPANWRGQNLLGIALGETREALTV